MNLARLDLNLLLVLDAIYSEGGITPASRMLHLSQPATSHALRRLRDHLDDPLFVRDGHRMRPTPLARSIIGPVRRALRDIETSLSQSQHFDPAHSQRRFCIGVRAALESTLLPSLIPRLEQQAPHIRLDVVRPDRKQLETDLHSGTLDLAIDTLLPVSSEVSHCLLGEDRLVVLARQNHPGIGQQLSLAEFLAAEHVLVSSRRSGPGFEDLELGRQGFQRQVRLRCQHHFTACNVVAESNLLLTMPERQARIANRCFGHQLFAFPLDTASLDVHLYWHRNVDREPANAWCRDLLIASMRDSLGSAGW